MFLPKVYQLLLKILQKKQVVYYNRYISIQNNESEDLIMSERKDPPEFTPKTCPVCGGRAMNAFKDIENFTSFEMVCWDCGKHHFYKMADDKKSFIKVDKL